jgi:transaldolase
LRLKSSPKKLNQKTMTERTTRATKKQKTGESQLDQLKALTKIVTDTGEIEAIAKFKPVDATTNPSLIYKAALLTEYTHLVDDAVAYGKGNVPTIMDKLAVNFGADITKIVPGYVSTEVDARLSFDTEGTIAKARRIIELYKEVGIDKSRILIKIAATWEGVQAAKVLEQEDGITCNLTLIFSQAQAIACGEAKCTLVSPFVGRIMDWYKKNEGVDGFEPSKDPGVISVASIYNYYKKYGYKTVVMGASFRNTEEIVELAGCDKLTIAPALLDKLMASTEPIMKKLDAEKASKMDIPKIDMDEKTFRWMMNQDAMATEKLAEGIRGFTADIEKLEKIVKSKIAA